jgi:ketosteroid isomerase-like protein
MSRTPAELATQLVQAFGRPDDIVALLADDITWWLTPAVPPEIMQSLSSGREAVYANMTRVFGGLYDAETVVIKIHSAISEGNLGTVRLTLSCEFAGGGSYINEYCVCVETRGDEIAKIWEYVDTTYAMQQLEAAGRTLPVGGPGQ